MTGYDCGDAAAFGYQQPGVSSLDGDLAVDCRTVQGQHLATERELETAAQDGWVRTVDHGDSQRTVQGAGAIPAHPASEGRNKPRSKMRLAGGG